VNTDVVLYSTSDIGNATIQLIGAQHLHFRNMTFKKLIQDFNYQDNIYLKKSCTNIEISGNNLINEGGGGGIRIDTSNFVTISNNNFNYNSTASASGVFIIAAGAKEISILRNILTGTDNGFDFRGSDSVSIIGNRIILTQTSTQSGGSQYMNCNYFTISKNHFEISGNNVFQMNAIRLNNSNISNNFFSLVSSNTLMGNILQNSNGVKFLHNTYYNNCFEYVGQNFTIMTNTKNCTIQNNIFVNEGTNRMIQINQTLAGNNINFDYNCYYTTGTVFAQYQTNTYNSISAWKTATGQDQNSIFQNVSFISATDLHLQTGQDFLKVNNPILQVTDDIDGEIRNNTNPYCGADEIGVSIDFTVSGFCQTYLTTFQLSNTADIQSVAWNFGDSQTSTQLNPTHTYANAGTYTVTLEVTFTDNSTQTIMKTIEIFDKPAIILIEHE